VPAIAFVFSRPTRSFAMLRTQVRHLGRKIAVAVMVRAERRALMGLDDAALKDMGFNTGQAHCEASRGFWDVPVDRLRR
jgi:uncharacterized protein YjiS (DUF1127 family)